MLSKLVLDDEQPRISCARKVEQIPVSAWDPQTVYETYVPIRDHDLDNK